MNKSNFTSLTSHAIKIFLGTTAVISYPLAAEAFNEAPIEANVLPGNGMSYQLLDPTFEFPATNHLMTTQPSAFNGAVVNNLIGANTFYNNGFTGQGTIAANIEAGHIWNGHESLPHVSAFSHHPDAWGTTTDDLIDRHATWVGGHIGGRMGGNSPGDWQTGIALDTDLRSGAVATQWSGSAYALGFDLSGNTLATPYSEYFGTANVINSSWGGTDTTGTGFLAIAIDGYAAMFPETTLVVSAGNSGPNANTVGAPGSGYNGITVGALQNDGSNNYSDIASFSSRGPMDYQDANIGTVLGVRAAVDITAPGTNLMAAFYGGQTGGNNPTLPGSVDNPGNSLYSDVAGTSFASPITAGGATLVNSASIALALDSNTRDSRVVKAVMMNAAAKPAGWDNGQVSNALGGVDTPQALDYVLGTGVLDLDQTYENYVNADTQDVLGLGGGNIGVVGFDYGELAAIGNSNFYDFDLPLLGGTEFTATLSWFRDRDFDPNTFTSNDIAQADLDLFLWDTVMNEIIASSTSLYDVNEHFSFVLPRTSQYRLEVRWDGNNFGVTSNTGYGLAWRAEGTQDVPEPSTILGLFAVGSLGLCLKRKK